MAAREVSGNLVTLQFSTNLNDPLNNLKTIVCEDSSDAGVESAVNNVPTKCGNFSATETPTATINGSGVINANPDADEASFQEVLHLANTNQRVYAVYQNEAEGDLAEGDGVFMAGHGYFSSARATAAQGTPTTFNWTFTFTGTVDTAYPASA